MTYLTPTERVRRAISAIQTTDPSYWEATLAQRAALSPDATGSVVLGHDQKSLERLLLESEEWEEFFHSEVAEGCNAYVLPGVRGRLGVVRLDDLPEGVTVTLIDRKGTGKFQAEVSELNRHSQPFVDYLVMITGYEDGCEMVWTFHPGPPVRPSTVTAETLRGLGYDVGGSGSLTLTPAEACQAGFSWAKIR